MIPIPQFINRFLRTPEVGGPEPGVGSVLAVRGPIIPSDWFVDPQHGSDSADGRDPRSPLATIAGALAKCVSGDKIYFVGNVREEITSSNLLEDISIIGMSNRPRHADHARDGIGNGAQGASWRQAASHGATTPLLIIRGQGWHLENFLMVPPSDAAAVKLERNALSGTSEYDASHFSAKGMRFVGGQSGIEDSGGHFNVLLDDCIFQANTDGIKTLNTAVAIPLQWEIRNCHFSQNTHHIRVSAAYWDIHDNAFGKFTTTGINLTFVAGNDAGELANLIWNNLLSGTYSAAGGYIEGGGNTDEWGGNYNVIAGGVTAAQPG